MEVTQITIAFASMLVLVVFLERAEKWMRELRAAKAEIDRRHDHGV